MYVILKKYALKLLRYQMSEIDSSGDIQEGKRKAAVNTFNPLK